MSTEISCDFFTKTHSGHDDCWILDGNLVAVVCFACLVETFEEKDLLKTRKKNILRELLHSLSTSNKVRDALASKPFIVDHVSMLLLPYIATDDERINDLTMQILLQFITELQSSHVIEKIYMYFIKIGRISMHDFAFIGQLFRAQPKACYVAVEKYPTFLNMIFNDVPEPSVKGVEAFWFVMANLYKHKECVAEIGIQHTRKILHHLVIALKESKSRDSLPNLVALFKYFTEYEFLIDVVRDYEKYLHHETGLSIGELFKQLMLSVSLELQIISVHSLTNLLKSSKDGDDFANDFIGKGLCDYLLDLLSTKDEILSIAVLKCLIAFSISDKLKTCGFNLYSIEPISEKISSLLKLRTKSLEAIKLGLSLIINLITTNEENTKSFWFEKDSITINICKMLDQAILNRSLMSNTDLILIMDALVRAKQNEVTLKTCFEILFRSGAHQLEEIKAECGKRSKSNKRTDDFNLLLSRLLLLFIENYLTYEKERKLDVKCSGFECQIYSLLDSVFVPLALMLAVQKKHQIFAIYLGALSLTLSDVDRIDCIEFGRKQAESSFLPLALDVKSHLAKTNQNNCVDEEINLIDQFMVSLCGCIEGPEKGNEVKKELSDCLPQLDIIPSDWCIFLSGIAADSHNHDRAMTSISAILALLYYNPGSYGVDKNDIVIAIGGLLTCPWLCDRLSTNNVRYLLGIWIEKSLRSEKEEYINQPNHVASMLILNSLKLNEILTFRFSTFKWLFHFHFSKSLRLLIMSKFVQDMTVKEEQHILCNWIELMPDCSNVICILLEVIVISEMALAKNCSDVISTLLLRVSMNEAGSIEVFNTINSLLLYPFGTQILQQISLLLKSVIEILLANPNCPFDLTIKLLQRLMWFTSNYQDNLIHVHSLEAMLLLLTSAKGKCKNDLAQILFLNKELMNIVLTNASTEGQGICTQPLPSRLTASSLLLIALIIKQKSNHLPFDSDEFCFTDLLQPWPLLPKRDAGVVLLKTILSGKGDNSTAVLCEFLKIKESELRTCYFHLQNIAMRNDGYSSDCALECLSLIVNKFENVKNQPWNSILITHLIQFNPSNVRAVKFLSNVSSNSTPSWLDSELINKLLPKLITGFTSANRLWSKHILNFITNVYELVTDTNRVRILQWLGCNFKSDSLLVSESESKENKPELVIIAGVAFFEELDTEENEMCALDIDKLVEECKIVLENKLK